MSGFLLERLFSQGFSITFSSGSTTACVKTSNILPSPSIACLVPMKRDVQNWNYKNMELCFHIARYQNFLFLHRGHNRLLFATTFSFLVFRKTIPSKSNTKISNSSSFLPENLTFSSSLLFGGFVLITADASFQSFSLNQFCL